MEYQFQIQCDQGAFRSNNEDAILHGVKSLDTRLTGSPIVKKQKIAWIVIADGMGGHNAGEVASEILTTHIESAINALDKTQDIDWSHWIIDQIKIANTKIFSQSQKNPSQSGMGTTGVIAILTDETAYVGWVGDSRCYWCKVKDGELKLLTRDHTMVQLFVDKGAMTQEEADKANNKNMLSRAIGIKATVDVDVVQHQLHKGDMLFLSTDGLHDSLSNTQLISYLTKASKGDPIEAQMLKDAIAAGSRDNISFGTIALI
ncbi:MAG: PP2C family protein-serine/threonine phosphatase [Kangiellaceae bacterium]